jgi:hypothetical protein
MPRIRSRAQKDSLNRSKAAWHARRRATRFAISVLMAWPRGRG